MRLVFVERENGPERLLCEAELVFEDGDGILQGMKLVGFQVWRGQEGDTFVTLPSRSFGAGDDRRFFDFLRPHVPGTSEARRIKDWINGMYLEHRLKYGQGLVKADVVKTEHGF